MSIVVLNSKTGYHARHDRFLQGLIDRRITLFCALGRQCELWEEVMDQFVVGESGELSWHVTTTSHPNESLEEVLEFARTLKPAERDEIEVIEI